MKDDMVIYDVVDLSECKKLDNNIKYITIDIKTVNIDVISYFFNNGNNYLYSERIDNKRGFVYVDYATFVKGQSVIFNITDSIPKGLSKLEIARYLYISLGKTVGYDINVIMDKNELFSLNNIGNINNIWSCLSKGKVSSISLSKIYLFLCSIFNIECELIFNYENNTFANKLLIDGNTYLVNLSKDIALIQAGFETKYFASFNSEKDIDKKIGYINREYNNVLIDKILSSINYMDEDVVFNILNKTQKILKVDKIKSCELSIIYNYIFSKYCPNYDIVINNLYINDKNQDHFILISYGDKYYSYNYSLKKFVLVDKESLINNLDDNKVCLYYDEIIPNLRKKSVLL